MATVVLTDPDTVIRVTSNASPQAVANAIRFAIFEQHIVPTVRAIGVGAVAQACKAIAIARGYVATRGFDLATTIGFETVPGDDGSDITAQTFHLFLAR